MKDERIINLLSMAQRAGKVASGEFAVEKALAAKKIELLLVAGDAADSTADPRTADARPQREHDRERASDHGEREQDAVCRMSVEDAAPVVCERRDDNGEAGDDPQAGRRLRGL